MNATQIAQLQGILTVNGRSFSSPVYKKDASGNPTTEIDMAASRRVEIKFRLKEDEMIDKIAEILAQDSVTQQNTTQDNAGQNSAAQNSAGQSNVQQNNMVQNNIP